MSCSKEIGEELGHGPTISVTAEGSTINKYVEAAPLWSYPESAVGKGAGKGGFEGIRHLFKVPT